MKKGTCLNHWTFRDIFRAYDSLKKKDGLKGTKGLIPIRFEMFDGFICDGNIKIIDIWGDENEDPIAVGLNEQKMALLRDRVEERLLWDTTAEYVVIKSLLPEFKV